MSRKDWAQISNMGWKGLGSYKLNMDWKGLGYLKINMDQEGSRKNIEY